MVPEILGADVLNPLGPDVRQPVIIAFLVFIGCSLLWLVTLITGQEDGPDRLYVANRSLPTVLNGFALAGEQITAVTLLALPGAIALFGYDGFAAAVDTLLALGVTLLLAQKIRNSGCYTLGDLFGLRASGPAPRIAAALVTLAITLPILLLQFRAAGIGASLLIGASTENIQVTCTIMIGGLVTCFAAVTELRGTTFMHVIKVPLTLVTLIAVTLLALKTFEWDPERLLSEAVNGSVAPDAYLSPGLWPYETDFGLLNDVGAHLVVILGMAVAPHLVLRLGASPSGRSARRSTSIAIALVSVFVALLVTTGFAATAVVGARDIGAVDGNGQSSLILLASEVLDSGSSARVVLITAISCVTFLAVLTAVSSVTFSAAVSLAHDVFARQRPGRTDMDEVRVLRLAVVALCVAGLVLAAATYRYQVEFLITFATSVAASCVFPALVLTFFWKRFNRRGLLWSVYGGLLLCILLMLSSPGVSGHAYALWPEANFAWYPLQTPGLLAIPAAFLLGWAGGVTSPEVPGHDFTDLEHTPLTERGVSPRLMSRRR
ncbi:transporter [Streptomyces sp. WAC00288]|uniref:sodium:solute symporter family transporter n=1 Tax=unclassified Streptomyces TaxID=2593676 RepID=UPI0007885098|nr:MULTISPECIES: transporter [unclassified Streptomyces]AVH98774.1 transporter [Streptomyces sp. WAC00288]KYG52326.1 transporter [Streptomyces sp. WAC04657]